MAQTATTSNRWLLMHCTNNISENGRPISRNRKGRKPDVQDNNAFASAVSTEDQLSRYRQNAADLIISFANQVVDDERELIQREAITTRIESAASTISGSAAFGKQVLTGLVASLITTFVLIVLAVATAFFGIDLLEGVSRLVEPE